MPSTIEKVYRERKVQKFTVLAVNIDEPADHVAAWVKARGLTMPVLLDKDAEVTLRYRVRATPTVVLIGRDGKLVGRAVGPRPWSGDSGRALLDALLAAPAR